MPHRPLHVRAKSLRSAQTPAERSVWKILRTPPFDAWHFRRQVPFGIRFIADFASHRARLIVEIDGATHDLLSSAEMQRTGWFEGQGYRIVRFTNSEAFAWRVVERTLMAELGIG